MTDDVTIRKATPQDVDAVHAMIVAIARTTDHAHRVSSTPQDFLDHGFGPAPRFETMVAERGGTPVGLCLYFYTFSSWLGEPGLYVQDLYVADSARGSGIGRRLLGAVAAIGHENDATHLRLSVDVDNADARAFYAALGMHHRRDEHTYHIGRADFLQLAERAS